MKRMSLVVGGKEPRLSRPVPDPVFPDLIVSWALSELLQGLRQVGWRLETEGLGRPPGAPEVSFSGGM